MSKKDAPIPEFNLKEITNKALRSGFSGSAAMCI